MSDSLLTVPPAPKHKGRQRCLVAQASILAATIKLMEEKPLRDITADSIAQGAGVSKATIYKWWSNKSLVALDAFLTQIQNAVETPNTGSAQKDFTEQVKSLIRFYETPSGKIFAQFIGESQSDPSLLVQFRERFLKARREEVRTMWQRGVDRGDIRTDIDGDIVLDLVYGPIIFRLLTGHAPLNNEVAEAVVSTVFYGCKR